MFTANSNDFPPFSHKTTDVNIQISQGNEATDMRWGASVGFSLFRSLH